MAGLYVHIPFCKSRCPYCDFYSTTLLNLREAYVDAVIAEYYARQNELVEPLKTIYFGGGTPSVLDAESISKMLNVFPLTAEEVTLEANPGDICPEKLADWKRAGVNRLSIGIQSLNNSMLQQIARRHTAEQAQQSVHMARQAGFTNISIDLMYGLPGQTLSLWEEDISKALQLNVEHISTYCLSYEDGTALTKQLSEGKIQAIDDDTENQMYDVLVATLCANGYMHYEVSNFAKHNHHSKHNSCYWDGTPYIGLGAGAHSYNGKDIRSWNKSDIHTYIAGKDTGKWEREIEHLSEEQMRMESIMLGLRTHNGIACSLVDQSRYLPYLKNGCLQEIDDRIMATTKGFHILNRIIQDLI